MRSHLRRVRCSGTITLQEKFEASIVPSRGQCGPVRVFTRAFIAVCSDNYSSVL